MSLENCPAEAIPKLLEGLACDGLQSWPAEPGENGNGAESVAFLPEEMERFEKEPAPESESFLTGDFPSSTEDPADRHASAHSAHDTIVGLAGALLVHVSLVLAALLLPVAGPIPHAESQFITVNLAGCGGAGAGGGDRGSGGSVAGDPSPSTVSIPFPDQAASPEPETEIQKVPPPEEPKQSFIVPPPPEAPVLKEKPPPVITPRPVKKQTVAAVRPKPARAPDTQTDAKALAPILRSEAPPSGTGPAPDGVGGGYSGAGGGDGGSGQGPGGGGDSGTGAGGTSGEFTLKQVEHPPVVLHKVHPYFPETARRMGVTGKVVAKFLVKPDGHVSKASILEVDPPGHFEQCVLDALSKWEFKPGTYKGKAVATWVVQPIHFRLTK